MPNRLKTSLQVVLLKTIKQGAEWLTNYGRDYWLKTSNYHELDTKTKKTCRDFYKFTKEDLIDDDADTSSDEEEANDDEEAASDTSSSDNSRSKDY